MTVDGRNSPVHVHVEKDTPIHVHLKKKKKKTVGIPTAVEHRLKTSHDKRMSGLIRKTSGHSRKTTTSSGASKKGKKLASPTFSPPPGKTSKKPLAWEGNSHCLEVAPAGVGALRMSDLSTDEEDQVHSHIRDYERKIDSLMSEVGSLKTERAIRAVEKKEEQLNASRRLIEEQEDEIKDWKNELKHTVKENEALRHSIEKYREDAEISRTETVVVRDERDKLIKQLVQVEIDAKAASEQLVKMKDTVRKLKEDRRMSAADVTSLSRERELLMQKLNEFEKTNRVARKLLRENKNKEEDQRQMKQQQQLLLRKLTEADDTVERLRVEIAERDRQIEALLTQVEADKDQVIAFRDLKKTMETTRGHLQNQLRSKEMEISRLTVQIRNLEQQLNESRIELEHIQGLVAAQRDKSSKEKEALKKAARAQKDRVLLKDSQLDELDQKLAEKEMQLVEAKKVESVLRDKCMTIEEERSNTEAEIKAVRSRLKELQEIISTSEKTSKSNIELLHSKLSTRSQEVASLRAENEQCRADIAAMEERLHENEQKALNKIEKYRREAEEGRSRLYELEQESQRAQQENALEAEKVKFKMSQRLSELEPIADLLKTSELRLQESQDRLLSYERRSSDHTKLIAELTQKVEMQTDQLESLREKLRQKEDDSRALQSKYELLDRKLGDSEHQNRELFSVISKKEESMNHSQQRMEDVRAENIRLTHQLEASISEARRQAESQREKAVAKERAAQARITDLEIQLNRATASAAQLKKAKDEAERRYNSKIFDMRDRLDQANSTTRSMQNYVAFLKSSYANVFDELEDAK